MKLEKTLVEMVCHFTPARASDWLRILFSSFETDLEPIAVDTTKNESAYFAEARRLGWVTHLPETDSAEAANKPLVVVAVRIKGDLTERTSRLVQFAFAKKVVQNAIARGGRGIHGLPTQGLFFFYDADGYFRISLVHGEADGRKLKYNSAKRQSFYVDPTAANNILRRRLGDTIKTFSALKNAFSVEQLTKEFYGRLFEWYTWALAPRTGVTFPNDLADEKDDRKYNHEAIIRLITRLMFTWFIRQKIPALKELFERERVAELLSKFEPGSMEQDNYYRCILQNLFFATFNCQPAKRAFIHIFQGKTDQRHITTLYRYEKEFKGKDGSRFKELMKTVPFLNCALFDCLDKIERKEDGGHKLYFDGFSGEKGFSAHVPNGLFFKEGRGIIDLFNGYEFTIDENSADDADVALDPELLGKVFENLLGAFNPETQETARKATGSFYTPREIVDYMVEESLKNYLKGRLPDTTKDIDPKLDDLFDRTKAAEGGRTMFSRKDEETLLDALYDCKVLDPACGSGAFPMGVLHCMVRLLARLDPDSISIRERLIARYRADKDSTDPAETASDRRERLAELEKCLDEGQHYPDYARKLYLIENCIYGVDIQPIATQISKLRFFISLLCDQFRTSFNGEDANYGLLALPNLEAKFVCANTLISLPETSGELDLTASGVMEARQRLKINRHRIFGARSTGTKEKYKKRDLEIRDEIREAVINGLAKPDESVIEACERQIKVAKSRREKVAEPKWEERVVRVQADLFSPFEARTERVDANRQERDTIDAEIAWAEKRIHDERAKAERSNVSAAQNYAALVAGWDPFDQNASSKFFDPEWMFNVIDGFDVVIGNPPYVEAKKLKEIVAPLKGKYDCASGTADLSVYFYERGLKMAISGGILSYICTNKFFNTEYGQKLRAYLRSHDLRCVIDFEQCEVFENVLVSSAITVVGNCPSKRDTIAYKKFHGLNHQEFIEEFKIRSNVLDEYPISELTDKEWSFADLQLLAVKAKIEERGKRIGDITSLHVYRGVTTGFNPAFIVDDSKRRELIAQDSNCASLVKKMLQGRNIRKWVYNESYEYLLQTGYDINIRREYPAIYKHLTKWEVELRDRSDQGVEWWNLRACKYYSSFEMPEKVIWGLTADKWAFAYDDKKHYLPSNGYILTSDEIPIRYLLGLLNSKLLHFYFGFIGIMTAGGAYTLKAATIEALPIPFTISEQQEPIIKYVDRILAAKKKDSNADVSALESEIDQLVYKLYGLTDDEIAIVEGRDKAAQEPQGDSTRRSVTSPRRRRQSPAPAPTESPDDEVLE